MSVSDEEPYSTIFASLKHPIRRRILRMLSKKAMSFSEMLEVLGVSSSFLNYHLENLGELVSKTDDGKYRLSSFGEAAMATMSNVEDIPASVLQQAQEHTSGKRTSNPAATKIVRRTTAIALGIICIVLVAGLLGTVAVLNGANSKIASLQSQITSDNATINSLASNVTDLQEKLDSFKNATSSVGDDFISDPSAWVNKTVVVEGSIEPAYSYFAAWPWNYELSSSGTFIGISWQGNNDFLFNGTNWVNTGVNVLVAGVVTEGQVTYLMNGNHTYNAYFIEAESIDTL
jgi:DNA-binding transcriptional ArsR family regulator/outer membrane murein-binding lipoprotein Lpp